MSTDATSAGTNLNVKYEAEARTRLLAHYELTLVDQRVALVEFNFQLDGGSEPQPRRHLEAKIAAGETKVSDLLGKISRLHEAIALARSASVVVI